MAAAKHRVVTARIVVASVVAGVVLAVVSVPASVLVSSKVLHTWKAPAFQKQYWLDEGDHQIYIYHRHNPFYAHWESSIVPLGMYGEPEPEFQRPASDPRPRYARRAFTGHVQSTVSMSAGWPRLAAQGRAVMDGTPPTFWDEGVRTVKLGTFFMHLPYRPIWLGLLGNTLFYATITLALLVLLRWQRTRRRRARGRCVACGYELGPTLERGVGVCPECGLDAKPNA